MLKKFRLEDSRPMKMPMSSDTKLTKDEGGESVDNTKYRGMIGTTHLGLWYPKGSGIETVVCANSDHMVDYVDQKSTSSICTFMGCCLTSWFLKKQSALAISPPKLNTTPSNASSSSSPPATMPCPSKLMKHFNKMENEFKKLFTLLEISSTPKSIFFTSREDTLLHDFCCKEVKLIFKDLHSFFKILQKHFPKEVKAMMDVFESMESDLDATWKQNKILNDQLLEATLKHDIERCVLMCNDFVNDNSLDEIEKVKWESIDVQENLLKQIKILENDF
ncbi:hypothetical protein Tco_0231012 [Tanacetum coccineum]